MTKERPILFSAPMVRAIMRRVSPKTQTRRVVKPQPYRRERSTHAGGVWFWERSKNDLTEWINWDGFTCEEMMRGGMPQYCPYGVPGVVLLVKESWRVLKKYDRLSPSKLPPAAWQSIHWAADGDKPATHGRTRPGRFLPNARVRTRLEVVSVRVERLQDISEADAVAEGFDTDICHAVIHERARRAKVRPGYYVERAGVDLQEEWCDKCVEGVDGHHRLLYGQSDSPAWCSRCGILLDGESMTDYGMARELFLEGHDDETRAHWPLSPDDAHVTGRFVSDVPDQMKGRLAQIAMATLWDRINGDGSWKSNPWVWVVEFKRVEAAA